jgi:hypothetical protein
MLFGNVVELWGIRYAIWECSRVMGNKIRFWECIRVVGNEVCYLGM